MRHLPRDDFAPANPARAVCHAPRTRPQDLAATLASSIGGAGVHPRHRAGGLAHAVPKRPMAGLRSAPQVSADQQGVSAQPGCLRVLIVEDEAVVAMELELLLEDLDAEVVAIAASAAEAYALVREYGPDFVTMDINIEGDRDGVSSAIEIFETYGVRSIFISSFSDMETRKRAATCQALAWIRKPINAAELALAVSRVRRDRG